MSITHIRENVAEQKGALLERWTGEVVPGDMINVTPDPLVVHMMKEQANLVSYSLLLNCQNRYTGQIEGDFSAHQAIFHLPVGRVVSLAADHSQWCPPVEMQVRWSSGVTPELFLDFLLTLTIHSAPRFLPVCKDFTGRPQPEAPKMLGILLGISWWVQPRKTNYLGGVML